MRWLLTHEAGLPAIAARMPFGSLSDWDAMTTALAAQAPWWEPGTAHGYHGVTFGHLIGEVLRRATGRDRRRDHRATELAAAARGRPAACRCPPALDARTADLIVDMSPDGTFFDRWDPPTSLGPRAFGNPPDCNDPNHCTTDAFRRAEIPAANLHSNARGLDRLFAVLAAGGSVRRSSRSRPPSWSTSSAGATCGATTS